MAFKIEVDKEACIGCGSCAAVCDNFELEEGKAYAKKTEVDEIGCNQEAADICPVQAIKITKE
jgi:ferredoxin